MTCSSAGLEGRGHGRGAELVHRVGSGAEVFWTGSSLEQCGPLDRGRCRGWADLTAALTANKYTCHSQ